MTTPFRLPSDSWKTASDRIFDPRLSRGRSRSLGSHLLGARLSSNPSRGRIKRSSTWLSLPGLVFVDSDYKQPSARNKESEQNNDCDGCDVEPCAMSEN